jgi:hypothetical protein
LLPYDAPMRALILVLLTGCRVAFSQWGGTQPREASDIKLALRADGGATTMAWRAIGKDPRVTMRAYDEATDEAQKAACTENCDNSVARGCRWSKQQRLDYFAVADLVTEKHENTVCLKQVWVKGSDNEDDDSYGDGYVCVESKITKQWSTSKLAFHVYDAATCEENYQLGQHFEAEALGDELVAKAAAEAKVADVALRTWRSFPQQLAIGDGPILGEDGQYALFRDSTFRSLVALHGGAIQKLMCCTEPARGDQLVRRGDLKYIELLLSFESALVLDGHQRIGAGAGLHLRRYAIAGGLQYGASATAVSAGDVAFEQLAGEIGYGIRPHGLVHLSANLAAGATWFVRDHVTKGVPYVAPNIHAVFRFETWWYFGADLGFAISDSANDARLLGPYGRAYAAITF